MTEAKVNIYTPQGQFVGYFLNPQVKEFQEGDYEIKGEFFDSEGLRISKIDFNPQILPYTADLSEIPDLANERIYRVYVQRGRQPVMMTGNVRK